MNHYQSTVEQLLKRPLENLLRKIRDIWVGVTNREIQAYRLDNLSQPLLQRQKTERLGNHQQSSGSPDTSYSAIPLTRSQRLLIENIAQGKEVAIYVADKKLQEAALLSFKLFSEFSEKRGVRPLTEPVFVFKPTSKLSGDLDELGRVVYTYSGLGCMG